MIRYDKDLLRASHLLMAWVSSLRNSDKLESAPFTDANQLGFLFFSYTKKEKNDVLKPAAIF